MGEILEGNIPNMASGKLPEAPQIDLKHEGFNELQIRSLLAMKNRFTEGFYDEGRIDRRPEFVRWLVVHGKLSG